MPFVQSVDFNDIRVGGEKFAFLSITLMERKSRLPLVRSRLSGELQGVRGRSCSRLPRALGNAEDGVTSAFPKGKQNEKIFLKL